MGADPTQNPTESSRDIYIYSNEDTEAKERAVYNPPGSISLPHHNPA